MSDTTKIQWADSTWNPWIGCTKVSGGCVNCYAENTTRARVLRAAGHETWGRGAKRSRTSEDYWKQPLRWNERLVPSPGHLPEHGEGERSRVFPSLCDWLDDEVELRWLLDFLLLIWRTENLDWLLLTKRPELFWQRMSQIVNFLPLADPKTAGFTSWLLNWLEDCPPKNVWIGTSVENQAMADKRIEWLMKIPATIRFLSVEPLLEKVDLFYSEFTNIDWVIVGGESGAKARPCNIQWVRDIVFQCKSAEVPCFVKQLGSHPVCTLSRSQMKGTIPDDLRAFSDPKCGDSAEWPEDLAVREYPKIMDTSPRPSPRKRGEGERGAP